MAVTTAYSNLYNSSGVPVAGRPKSNNAGGGNSDFVAYTFPTTQLDDAGDVTYLIPVRSGKRILFLLWDSAELDTGGGNALDMDLVLRTTDSAGNHTDTIIYNAGTAFSAALAGKFVPVNVLVPTAGAAPGDVGHIIAKVGVAASTAAQGAISLFAQID